MVLYNTNHVDMINFPIIPSETILTANADQILMVPETFDEFNFPPIVSKGSTYFCKAPYRFIVDIKMATYSNTDPILSNGQPIPSHPTGKVFVCAVPWDVPGSYLLGGEWRHPLLALKEDSDRYKFIWNVHLKHGDGEFVELVNVVGSSIWTTNAPQGIIGYSCIQIKDSIS